MTDDEPDDELDDLIDTETHDELVQAYLDYFTKVEQYKRRRSHRTAIHARKALTKISHLVRIRRKEITNDHRQYIAARKDRRENPNI